MAELTGLSPVLLRAWERRHDLLRPDRTDGGHRLYTEDDLRVLGRVQELLAQGRTIGEVEALGRDALLGSSGPAADQGAPDRRAASRWGERLVEAGLTLDGARGERALDDAFAALSPERVLAEVAEPALRELGARWSRGACSVAGEHLVTGLVSARLHRLHDATGAHANAGARAISACLPDEQHALGSLTLAYVLARRGYRVSWLGPSLPFEDLDRACEQLAPEVLFLSVSRPSLLEAHTPALVSLARRRRGLDVVVGGGGVTDEAKALRQAGIVTLTGSALALDLAGLGLPRRRRRARRGAR